MGQGTVRLGPFRGLPCTAGLRRSPFPALSPYHCRATSPRTVPTLPPRAPFPTHAEGQQKDVEQELDALHSSFDRHGCRPWAEGRAGIRPSEGPRFPGSPLARIPGPSRQKTSVRPTSRPLSSPLQRGGHRRRCGPRPSALAPDRPGTPAVLAPDAHPDGRPEALTSSPPNRPRNTALGPRPTPGSARRKPKCGRVPPGL